jgi:hypothetical protein
MPLYSPPTHEEGIRSPERILRFYRLTTANTLVKVNGTWTSMRVPSPELLANLTHGVDYLRGGYIYDLDSALITELTTAGFPSGPTT